MGRDREMLGYQLPLWFQIPMAVVGVVVVWVVVGVIGQMDVKSRKVKEDRLEVLEKQVAQNKADIEGIVDLLETQKKTWQMQHEFNEATNTRINQLRSVSQ